MPTIESHSGTLNDGTAHRIQFICKLLCVIGVLVQVFVYTGPSYAVAVGVALFGAGLVVHTLVDLYQYQPQLPADVVKPYGVGVLLATFAVAGGVGYELIDYRVGVPFFVIFAGGVMLFSRTATYSVEGN